MKPYTEIPEDAECFIAYGKNDFTPGSNFFFVVFPKKCGRWSKLDRSMARFASEWLDAPYRKKDRWSGRTEILISGIDGQEPWADLFKNRVDGKNVRLWVWYNVKNEEMEVIEFDKPTPISKHYE